MVKTLWKGDDTERWKFVITGDAVFDLQLRDLKQSGAGRSGAENCEHILRPILGWECGSLSGG